MFDLEVIIINQVLTKQFSMNAIGVTVMIRATNFFT